MSDEVTVKVLHNMDSRFMPYEPGHRLLQVARFECAFPACGSVDRLLGIIFEQLNIGGDPEFGVPAAPWTTTYRAAGNRSLSVGDVVIIGEQAFAAQWVGWTPVTLTKEQIWFDLGKIADDDAPGTRTS
jgi:hypothetical protein